MVTLFNPSHCVLLVLVYVLYRFRRAAVRVNGYTRPARHKCKYRITGTCVDEQMHRVGPRSTTTRTWNINISKTIHKRR
jgi:hypothetical protein